MVSAVARARGAVRAGMRGVEIIIRIAGASWVPAESEREATGGLASQRPPSEHSAGERGPCASAPAVARGTYREYPAAARTLRRVGVEVARREARAGVPPENARRHTHGNTTQ